MEKGNFQRRFGNQGGYVGRSMVITKSNSRTSVSSTGTNGSRYLFSLQKCGTDALYGARKPWEMEERQWGKLSESDVNSESFLSRNISGSNIESPFRRCFISPFREGKSASGIRRTNHLSFQKGSSALPDDSGSTTTLTTEDEEKDTKRHRAMRLYGRSFSSSPKGHPCRMAEDREIPDKSKNTQRVIGDPRVVGPEHLQNRHPSTRTEASSRETYTPADDVSNRGNKVPQCWTKAKPNAQNLTSVQCGAVRVRNEGQIETWKQNNSKDLVRVRQTRDDDKTNTRLTKQECQVIEADLKSRTEETRNITGRITYRSKDKSGDSASPDSVSTLVAIQNDRVKLSTSPKHVKIFNTPKKNDCILEPQLCTYSPNRKTSNYQYVSDTFRQRGCEQLSKTDAMCRGNDVLNKVLQRNDIREQNNLVERAHHSVPRATGHKSPPHHHGQGRYQYSSQPIRQERRRVSRSSGQGRPCSLSTGERASLRGKGHQTLNKPLCRSRSNAARDNFDDLSSCNKIDAFQCIVTPEQPEYIPGEKKTNVVWPPQDEVSEKGWKATINKEINQKNALKKNVTNNGTDVIKGSEEREKERKPSNQQKSELSYRAQHEKRSFSELQDGLASTIISQSIPYIDRESDIDFENQKALSRNQNSSSSFPFTQGKSFKDDQLCFGSAPDMAATDTLKFSESELPRSRQRPCNRTPSNTSLCTDDSGRTGLRLPKAAKSLVPISGETVDAFEQIHQNGIHALIFAEAMTDWNAMAYPSSASAMGDRKQLEAQWAHNSNPSNDDMHSVELGGKPSGYEGTLLLSLDSKSAPTKHGRKSSNTKGSHGLQSPKVPKHTRNKPPTGRNKKLVNTSCSPPSHTSVPKRSESARGHNVHSHVTSQQVSGGLSYSATTGKSSPPHVRKRDHSKHRGHSTNVDTGSSTEDSPPSEELMDGVIKAPASKLCPTESHCSHSKEEVKHSPVISGDFWSAVENLTETEHTGQSFSNTTSRKSRKELSNQSPPLGAITSNDTVTVFVIKGGQEDNSGTQNTEDCDLSPCRSMKNNIIKALKRTSPCETIYSAGASPHAFSTTNPNPNDWVSGSPVQGKSQQKDDKPGTHRLTKEVLSSMEMAHRFAKSDEGSCVDGDSLLSFATVASCLTTENLKSGHTKTDLFVKEQTHKEESKRNVADYERTDLHLYPLQWLRDSLFQAVLNEGATQQGSKNDKQCTVGGKEIRTNQGQRNSPRQNKAASGKSSTTGRNSPDNRLEPWLQNFQDSASSALSRNHSSSKGLRKDVVDLSLGSPQTIDDIIRFVNEQKNNCGKELLDSKSGSGRSSLDSSLDTLKCLSPDTCRDHIQRIVEDCVSKILRVIPTRNNARKQQIHKESCVSTYSHEECSDFQNFNFHSSQVQRSSLSSESLVLQKPFEFRQGLGDVKATHQDFLSTPADSFHPCLREALISTTRSETLSGSWLPQKCSQGNLDDMEIVNRLLGDLDKTPQNLSWQNFKSSFMRQEFGGSVVSSEDDSSSRVSRDMSRGWSKLSSSRSQSLVENSRKSLSCSWTVTRSGITSSRSVKTTVSSQPRSDALRSIFNKVDTNTNCPSNTSVSACYHRLLSAEHDIARWNRNTSANNGDEDGSSTSNDSNSMLSPGLGGKLVEPRRSANTKPAFKPASRLKKFSWQPCMSYTTILYSAMSNEDQLSEDDQRGTVSEGGARANHKPSDYTTSGGIFSQYLMPNVMAPFARRNTNESGNMLSTDGVQTDAEKKLFRAFRAREDGAGSEDDYISASEDFTQSISGDNLMKSCMAGRPSAAMIISNSKVERDDTCNHTDSTRYYMGDGEYKPFQDPPKKDILMNISPCYRKESKPSYDCHYDGLRKPEEFITLKPLEESMSSDNQRAHDACLARLNSQIRARQTKTKLELRRPFCGQGDTQTANTSYTRWFVDERESGRQPLHRSGLGGKEATSESQRLSDGKGSTRFNTQDQTGGFVFSKRPECSGIEIAQDDAVMKIHGQEKKDAACVGEKAVPGAMANDRTERFKGRNKGGGIEEDDDEEEVDDDVEVEENDEDEDEDDEEVEEEEDVDDDDDDYEDEYDEEDDAHEHKSQQRAQKPKGALECELKRSQALSLANGLHELDHVCEGFLPESYNYDIDRSFSTYSDRELTRKPDFISKRKKEKFSITARPSHGPFLSTKHQGHMQRRDKVSVFSKPRPHQPHHHHHHNHHQYRSNSTQKRPNGPFAASNNSSVKKFSFDQIKVPSIEKERVRFACDQNGEWAEIGRGSYGCVYLGLLDSALEVAIKDFYEASSWDLVIHEARMLLYLQNTGVTPAFYGLRRRFDASKEPSEYCIIMEYFGDGRTLFNVLSDKMCLSRDDWMDVVGQLVAGLRLIHRKNVLINDLKADNILIDLSPGRKLIRYIDVGMATYKHGLMFQLPQDQMNKYNFLAPEVREGGHTSTKSDIYSLGYMLEQICRVADGGLGGLDRLVVRCMDKNPAKRPTIDMIVSQVHQYISSKANGRQFNPRDEVFVTNSI